MRGRPSSFIHALELSKSVANSAVTRHLEDGPYGGIPIYSGEKQHGESVEAPLDDHETGWGAARILDVSVAQVAHALSAGKLWLPAEPEAFELPMAKLSEVGERGLDSQMFISVAHKGPFTKSQASPTATYPSLWSHHAPNETRMICNPDSQLLVRPGMESEAAKIWATASRVHLNREFTFGAQALTIAFTEQVNAGGRAWPNVFRR